ncbi:MAG: helix-turn-helix domain-containing protein [Solirubrobacteraceae bacterium]
MPAARSESRPAAGAEGEGAAPLVGAQLRERRFENGMSLRELARRLDVSPSLVSQIETGKIQPSVRTLYAMVSELGVSLDEMFAPAEHEAPPPSINATISAKAPILPEPSGDGGLVQRAGERNVIDLEAGVRWERLTTRNDREVEFLFTVYPVGSESSPADSLVRHNGREFGIVLTGKLNVTVGFDDYVLGAGDSVFFESTVPHRLHNEGAEDVSAVWVVLGRQS